MKRNRKFNHRKKRKRYSVEELQVLKEQQRLKYIRQRRSARKRQMFFLRIKSLLRFGGVVFTFLFVLYFLLMPQWNLNPIVFMNYPNQHLIFKGNLITKDEQIIQKLRMVKVPSKPIYLLNTKNFKDKLQELDPISKVYIRRYWMPSRLSFTFIEKTPWFLVYNSVKGEPTYSITQDGSTIKREYLPLPKAYDDSVYKLIFPLYIEKWDEKTLSKYYKLIKLAEELTGEKLIYMDIRDPQDTYIKLAGTLVRLGQVDETVLKRVARLGSIFKSEEVKQMKDKIEYIDLRWEKSSNIKEKVSKEQLEREKYEKQKLLELKKKQNEET